MTQVEIISNNKIAQFAYLLEFQRKFDFQPGQVISISVGSGPPRMYSIASGSKDVTIKILYDIKPGGELTPKLSHLKKGDIINVSPPFGKFFSDKNPAYWIAHGTGIAPFYSMFRSGLATEKTLIQGGRARDSFYFHDEFEQYFSKDNYVCCSSIKEQSYYPGRLTKFLKEQNNLPAVVKYYLCGSAEMVVEVRDILIEKKIPYINIIAEIFF